MVPPRLVLASRSPRRQEALSGLGLAYEIVVSGVEDELPPAGDPADPVPVAEAKAQDIAARVPDAVVLAGDTIVVVDDQALGKPESAEHARQMLGLLRGRQHRVRTGVAVAWDGRLARAEVACPLVMRDYTGSEIDAYVAGGEPMDCAGAYDVHREGGKLVQTVAGCFAAVVGLPIVQAARMLAAAGIAAPNDPVQVCTRLYGQPCVAGHPHNAGACMAPEPTTGI